MIFSPGRHLAYGLSRGNTPRVEADNCRTSAREQFINLAEARGVEISTGIPIHEREYVCGTA
jgi:hypothetical protein